MCCICSDGNLSVQLSHLVLILSRSRAPCIGEEFLVPFVLCVKLYFSRVISTTGAYLLSCLQECGGKSYEAGEEEFSLPR